MARKRRAEDHRRFACLAAGVCLMLLACGSRSDLDFLSFGGSDSDSDSGPSSIIGADGSARKDASTIGKGDAATFDAHVDHDGSSRADASTIDSGVFGWPRTWGGAGYDFPEGIAVDGEGSVIVVGTYEGTVDFDPGPGVDFHTSNGVDAFVTKFSADGTHLWTDTWGSSPAGPRDDTAYRVATAADGSIVVCGTFATTVDFDPGAGVDDHTPTGNDFSAYVTKLDTDGNQVWTRTWGSSSLTSTWGVGAAPDGSVFVAGAYADTVDLDPGAGEDDHASNGSIDAYVIKLDASGAFAWGRVWGGTGTEENAGVLGVDDTGAVVVGGTYQGTADFDPGPGVDNRTGLGAYNLFLVKLDADGTRVWARTIDDGAGGGELPYDVFVAGDGSVAFTGSYYGAVDFDPTSGVDVHTPGAQYDAFVMRLNADGSYVWTRTFGGSSFTERSEGATVAIDSTGRVIVGGSFYETVDFDPGPGVVSRTAVGNDDTHTDMYLLRLGSNGDFGALRTWGAAGFDYVSSARTNSSSAIFATGLFSDTVDLSSTSTPDFRTSSGSYDAFALEWQP